MAAGQPPLVEFPFGVNLEKFVSEFERAQTLVRDLANTTANAQKGMQQAFDETARAEKQVATSANEATAAVTKTTAATVAQEKAAAAVATTTKTGAAATSAGTAEITKITNATNKAVSSQNAFAKGFGLIRTAANILPGLGISGIFLLIFEGVSKAAEALGVFSDKETEVARNARLLNEVQQDASKLASKQITDAQALYRVATDVNQSTKDRTDAVKALKAEFPEYFKNIDEEVIKNGGALSSYQELTQAIIQRSRATAAQKKIDEENAKLLDIQMKQYQGNKDAVDALDKSTQNLSKNASKVTSFAGNIDPSQISEAQKAQAIQQQINQQRVNDGKKTQEALYKTQVEEIEANIRFYTQFAGGELELAKAVEFGDKAKIKALDDAAKRDEEKRKKIAERARKLAEEESKNYQNLLAKLLNEEAAFQAKQIPDNRAAEIAASDAHFEQLKKDRKREIEQAKVTDEQRKDLLKEYLNFEQDATDAAAQERVKINAKYDAQELKLRQAALKAIAELGDNALEEEINKIRQSYVERAGVIKAGGELNEKVQKQLDENEARDIADVTIKYGNERIKKQEELDIATTKVSQQYAGKSVEIERKKQVDILDIQINAQLDRIELLKANGKTENDLEVKQAQQALAALEEARKGLQKSKGQQSLFEFLGISTDAQKDIAKYATAFQAAGKVVSDFAQTFVDAYDRQLKAKQAVVDQDNKDIDDLESRLDKEKELKDAGYANDYDRLQAELQDKKDQRDEDQKAADEAQKKKEAAQKVQLIADTISQASNLITAASEIFAAFSAIPFVGVPLAIAAIAAMLTAFAAAKVNAYKAIGQQYGEGGEIDGPSHASGGKKYYSNDGQVRELEGGEMVIRKSNYQRSKELSNAINDGSLWKMHPESLESMLNGMGIELPKDSPGAMVVQVQKRDEAIKLAAGYTGNSTLESIDKNVGYLANKKKNEPEVTEDDTFFYKKKGNTIYKIRKKN